jgi:hypothetical protein
MEFEYFQKKFNFSINKFFYYLNINILIDDNFVFSNEIRLNSHPKLTNYFFVEWRKLKKLKRNQDL